jgi:DNA-binding NtrC family response regulator
MAKTEGNMAAILVCDGDRQRQLQLKNRLQKQGHEVWLAERLERINAILHDVPINVMVLDLDRLNLDALIDFAGRWRGIKILCETSDPGISHDFRTWMADALINKSGDDEQIAVAIDRLLNNGPSVINSKSENRQQSRSALAENSKQIQKGDFKSQAAN